MNSPTRKRRAGFTITELMVSMAVLSLVFIGLYHFTIDTTRILFVSTEKLEINRDVRSFTAQMSAYARASNHFFVYKSFYEKDRDELEDRSRDGETGDFLLLIFQQPWPGIEDPEHITRLVGYFRRPDGTNWSAEGPVYRFEINYRPGAYPNTQTTTPEELIAGLSSTGNYDQVLQLARGMADGKLFYNFFDRSIMIKAELIHGNAAKRVTDTYNFTISPRG